MLKIFCCLLVVGSFWPNQVHGQVVQGVASTPPFKVYQAIPPARKTIHLGDLQNNYEIIGPLGRPLKELMTVTIELPGNHMKGDDLTMFNVHSVNGYQLRQPIRISARAWTWARGLPAGWQTDRVYEVRAFQDLMYHGNPPDQALQENGVGPIQLGGHDMKPVLEIIGPASKAPFTK